MSSKVVNLRTRTSRQHARCPCSDAISTICNIHICKKEKKRTFLARGRKSSFLASFE